MANDKSLEERVSAVEIELVEVRRLAVKASKDAAACLDALRAQKRSLSSLESMQEKILVVVERMAVTQEQQFAELGATQLEQAMQLRSLAIEMQDLRQTQVRHYADHKAEAKSLRGDVAMLKGDVAELKGDVATLKGDVAQLKGDVAELKGDVAQLKGDVAELKGDISEIKQGMARLELAVGRLGGGVGDERS